jgi:hypothetical protein
MHTLNCVRERGKNTNASVVSPLSKLPLENYHWAHKVTLEGVLMNNEAKSDNLGDSSVNSVDETKDAKNHASDDTSEAAAPECSNGVCVLTWKPSRAA